MTESVAAGESEPNNNNNNNNGELFSIPRGGPIYVANLVGSLTSVPYFQSSLLLELQNLQVELSSDTTQVPEEDISVDELKIFTEEELVDMAMKEAFKEGEEADNASALPEESSSVGRQDENGMPNDKDACLENSGRGRDSAKTNCNGTSSKNKLKKRKRKMVHNHTVEDGGSLQEGEEAGNASALPEEPTSEGRKDDNVMSNDKDACLENSGSGRDSAKTNCNGTSSKNKLKKRKRRMVHRHTVEEGKDTNNPSAISEEPSIEGRKDDYGISNDGDVCLVISGKGRNGSAENGCNRTVRNKNMKKKKNAHNHTVEIRYIEKVEQLAKIKQKQDEDKASVTLHSFNRAIPSSEKTERMKLLRSANAATKVKSSSFQEHIAVTYPEVALSIEVYHNTRKWVKTHEFLVLGQQTLTELRDKIYCLTDQVMQKAGQHDPSGYFLIEDVFCNDLRNPSAIDYSEPIFDWLQNNKEEALKKWECIISGDLQQKQKAIMGDATVLKVPNFKAVNMHQTRFSDLKFRLGAGYLYCHQGNCKHTIVFRDMRLIHPEDVQNKAAYPIVLFQLKPRVQKCYVCKIYRATKVTVDDKWARDNPCYFCDDCYYLLHYKDGSLLYSDFSVYDYLHD